MFDSGYSDDMALDSKILKRRYANMPKLADINSLFQLISTCEI